MPSQRQMRVNSLLKEEISRIIQRELGDPEVRLTTITSVEVSPDLRTARVFVSTLGEEPEIHAAMATLVRSRKRLQAAVGRDVELRNTPRLTFIRDTTAAHAQRIETLLEKIAGEPPLPEAPTLALLEEESREALDGMDEDEDDEDDEDE